jgi:hypothetical protein
MLTLITGVYWNSLKYFQFRKQRTKDRFDLDEARSVKASSSKFKKVGS